MTTNHHSRPPMNAVDLHQEQLVARAIKLALDSPDLNLVALVAEADSSEAASLRRAPGDVLHGKDGSVAVLITRDSAKKFLGQVTPVLLDWLEDVGEGSVLKLAGLPRRLKRLADHIN